MFFKPLSITQEAKFTILMNEAKIMSRGFDENIQNKSRATTTTHSNSKKQESCDILGVVQGR
jgi:hypothetical protein